MREHMTFTEEEVQALLEGKDVTYVDQMHNRTMIFSMENSTKKTVTKIIRQIVGPGVCYETHIIDPNHDAALYLIIEHHDHFGGSHFDQILLMRGPISKCLAGMNKGVEVWK